MKKLSSKKRSTKRFQFSKIESFPVPGSSAEMLHLLIIFPDEVWRSVLANVDNAKNYYAIYKASTFFQVLLSPQRKHALFSEVISTIVQRERTWRSSNLRKMAYLRLVCHSWKTGVDRYIQQTTLQDKKFLNVWDQHYSTTKFIQLADFQRFQRHFSATHCSFGVNPFLARRVMVYLPRRQDQLMFYYGEWFQLLYNYGRHIWYLSLQADITEYFSQHDFYIRLKHMFQLMPNLRILKFDIRFSYTTSKIPEVRGWHLAESDFAHPFPMLKRLMCIEKGGLPFSMFQELIKKDLPSLGQLGMRLNSREEFKAFCKLNLPLTKISLDMMNVEPFLFWGEIFSALEYHFGETLTDLQISLPTPCLYQYEDYLRLKNLKNLHLKLTRPERLDFLVHLANNLEDLTVDIGSRRGMELERIAKEERGIKFYRYIGQLHKSNIWTMFPKLKRVAFQARLDEIFQTCTREDWKAKNTSCCIM